MNKQHNDFIQKKKQRREKKRSEKRDVTGEEVIFIFEKILEDWKTIRIYNTIIQSNPHSHVTKKKVEQISTGNSKVYESELETERYTYYKTLREKVYDKHKNDKQKDKDDKVV
jgi:hypothetical protein